MRILIFVFLIIFFIPTAEAVKGDCNNDGEFTSVDALIALKMAVGKIEPEAIADMNNDEVVTSYDAYRILMLVTGEEDELFWEIGELLRSYDLGKYLKDERMNWIIEKKDGSRLIIGVEIEKSELKEFLKGSVDNPSINAYANEDTVRRLLEFRSAEEFKKALESGEIKLEGVGIFNQIRVSVMNFVSKFLR
jgi:hypothetical protein